MTLVLAGGGVAGIAWELGVLHGLADADAGLAQKVIGADTVIGTSSGSSVAAQITSGTPLDQLYDAQFSADTAEIDVKLDMTEYMSRFGAAIAGAVDETDRRRRVGAFALAASTVPETKRRAVIAARLPAAAWPDRDLRIPAVDAVTGEVVIFTRDSGVTLVDAVAASCAVPGIWESVRFFVGGAVTLLPTTGWRLSSYPVGAV
jgi:NTE family protein